VQIVVEVALLVVVAFANVSRDVHAPVGLTGINRKTFPAEMICESNAAQRSCYRFCGVTVDTWSNTLRVSVLQQQQQQKHR